MCKISIIMPVYNKEKYIKKAIESILNQTFKDWEMLIIDDGSTDDSLAVCRIFEDPRIHVISTENGGVSHARNIGVDKAQGEYLTFVDGDDYLAADYLENLYIEPYDMIIGGLKGVSFCSPGIRERTANGEDSTLLLQGAADNRDLWICCGKNGEAFDCYTISDPIQREYPSR